MQIICGDDMGDERKLIAAQASEKKNGQENAGNPSRPKRLPARIAAGVGLFALLSSPFAEGCRRNNTEEWAGAAEPPGYVPADVAAEKPDAATVPTDRAQLDQAYFEQYTKMLGNDDPNIRKAAAGFLGEFARPEVVAALVKALDDPEPAVQFAAVNSILRIHPLGVQELKNWFDNDSGPLTRMAQSEHIGMRRSALIIIGIMGSSRGFSLAAEIIRNDQDGETRREAIRVLERVGGNPVFVLLEALKESTDSGVRRDIINNLGSWGMNSRDREAIRVLGKIIKNDPDNEVRAEAAWALGFIGKEMAVPMLIEAVRENADSRVRRSAAQQLGQIGDGRGVDILLQVVKSDADFELRVDAVKFLGWMDGCEVPALIEIAKSEMDSRIRSNAADMLGWNDDTRAISTLIELVKNDPDDNLRARAISGLSANMAETRQKRRAVPAVIEAMRESSNHDLKIEAMRFVGEQMQDQRAVDPLVGIMRDNDEDIEIRVEAADALGYIGGSRAANALIRMIKQEEYETLENGIRRLMYESNLTKAAALALWNIGRNGLPAHIYNFVKYLTPADSSYYLDARASDIIDFVINH